MSTNARLCETYQMQRNRGDAQAKLIARNAERGTYDNASIRSEGSQPGISDALRSPRTHINTRL